jgi:hypothetical protein
LLLSLKSFVAENKHCVMEKEERKEKKELKKWTSVRDI